MRASNRVLLLLAAVICAAATALLLLVQGGGSASRASTPLASGRRPTTSEADDLRAPNLRPSLPVYRASTPTKDTISVDEPPTAAPPEQAPARRLDAAQRRAAFEREFSKSGPANGEWVIDATRSFDRGMAVIRAVDPHAELLGSTCYHNGCIATLRFANRDARDKAVNQLLFSAALMDWPGQKVISGPDVQSDSSVISDWVLLRPLTPENQPAKKGE